MSNRSYNRDINDQDRYPVHDEEKLQSQKSYDEPEVYEIHKQTNQQINDVKSMPKITEIVQMNMEELTDEIVKVERDLTSKNQFQRNKLNQAQTSKGDKLQEYRTELEKVSQDIDYQSEYLLKLKQRQHEMIKNNMN